MSIFRGLREIKTQKNSANIYRVFLYTYMYLLAEIHTISLIQIFANYFILLNINIMANDASGMKWIRSRNKTGPLRKKRWDTHVVTIEKQYDIDLGVRWDMHLSTLLKKEWVDSLNDLITWK